jgi:hypothetical protein
MALFPCDAHKGRYRGPQQTAYPALVHGGNQLRSKRRLCPGCFEAVQQFCMANLSDAAVDDMREDGCALCPSDTTDLAVFVTLYARGAEQQDWYGRVCRPCGEGAAAMALFGAQTTLEWPSAP